MTARETSINSPGMRRIVAVLLASSEPLDMKEIGRRAHLSEGTVYNYRIQLMTAGLIHISGYRKEGPGEPTPLFAAGRAPSDPVRPPPRKWESEAERARHYRYRMGSTRARTQRAMQSGKSMLAVLAATIAEPTPTKG